MTVSRMNRKHSKLPARAETRARGAEQRALPLRPKRRRPTLAYVLELERQLLNAKITIGNLKRWIRKSSAVADVRLAA